MRRLGIVLASIVSMLVIAGCGGDRPSSPLPVRDPSFAKASGGITDPTSTFYFHTSGSGVTGYDPSPDQHYTSGDSVRYKDGECGVDSKIFSTTSASNSGDAIMQTDNPRFSDRHCAEYPRLLTIDYGGGTVGRTSVFVNVHDIERENDPADILPIGGSKLTPLHLNDTRCGGLVWALALGDGTPTGADKVIVTRTAANTFVVTTQAAPNDKAYCTADGQLYHIAVNFTVVASRALAVPAP